MKHILTLILCGVFSLTLAQKKSSTTKRKTSHSVVNKKSTPASKKYTTTKKNNHNSNSQKLSFGVKAGAGFGIIGGGDKYRTLKMKPVFHGGIFAKYKLDRNINLQMESTYQHFGSSIELKEYPGVKGYWELSHIAVPILFQYQFSPNFYAETGPELDIVLQSRQVITDMGNYNFQNKETDFKPATKSTFYSWALGTGYYFNPNFGLNLRYSIGLNTPYKKRTDGLSTEKFRTHNVQLGVMYQF